MGTALASHPGGSVNTPSRFMLMKPEISAGLMVLLARKQRLYFTLLYFYLMPPAKALENEKATLSLKTAL